MRRKIIWIRHGLCAGNLEKRYVGVTDEPLCGLGREKLLQQKERGYYTPAKRVYASPMKRCLETAALLYPMEVGKHIVIPEFAECDFGRFEGKNYGELMKDEQCCRLYQRWIDSGGSLPFPEGESREGFQERSIQGFRRLLAMERQEECAERTCGDEETIVCIVHGGTIMAVLSAFAEPRKDYFAWQIANGEQIVTTYEERKLNGAPVLLCE